MNHVIKNRRVEDRRSIEVLAGHGRADHGEDAGANHRANAQRGQRPGAQGFLEAGLRALRVRDKFIYGLLGE